MAVQVRLDSIPERYHAKILKDLTVTPLDVTYETMKKIGRIAPGYAPKTDTSVSVYDISSVITTSSDKTEDSTTVGSEQASSSDPILTTSQKSPTKSSQTSTILQKYISLPYRYAKDIFKRSNDHIDHRDLPGLPEHNLYHAQLKDEQAEVAVECFRQLEINGTTIVGLYPGFGKTYIGSWLSYHLGLMTMVVAPRQPLLDSWTTTFRAAMPWAKLWIVGVNDKEYNFDAIEYDDQLPDIIICLDPRIGKIPSDVLALVGTLIIDEAHMIATPSRIKGLLSIFPRYVILETATLERPDGMHSICHLIAGKEGVFVTSNDRYTLYDVQLPFIEATEISTSMGVSYGGICSSLAENDMYNNVILGIVMANPSRKFILLTRLVKHANVLKKLLNDNGIEADTLVGTKKRYSDSTVLIGTFSKIGVGFDEATACDTFAGRKSDTMILCHSVKTVQNFEQFRGRVMRVKNPEIYWLTPKNKMIKRHLYGLRDWIAQTNGKIVKVDGRDYV